MFPVSLEFKDGEVATVFPPCYGFLKHNQWDGGGDDDYQITYEVIDGWHFQFEGRNWRSSVNMEGMEPEEVVLGDYYSLSNLSTIWNSGTHYPMWGVREFNEEPEVEQYFSDKGAMGASMCEVGKAERPLSNVEIWASKEGNDATVTMKRVMEMFDSWLDSELECCFEWQENGCFGVKASAPADRCLFYLMLNRSLNSDNEYDVTATMLDLIFHKKVNPVVALFTSRIVVLGSKSLMGDKKVEWIGNDYDSCIFPISLISTGICSRFEEPVQIEWRQKPYSEGEGHKRDEDFANLMYDGEFPRVNNSMFLPIMHPYLNSVSWGTPDEDCKIKGNPLMVDFCRAISLDEDTFNKLHKNSFGRVDFYGTIQRLTTGSRYVEEHYSVIPSEQWIDLVVNLLTSK